MCVKMLSSWLRLTVSNALIEDPQLNPEELFYCQLKL